MIGTDFGDRSVGKEMEWTMGSGKTQYGKNEDGTVSICKAKPGNEGRYGCFHKEHADLTPEQAQEINEKAAAMNVANHAGNVSLSKMSVNATAQAKVTDGALKLDGDKDYYLKMMDEKQIHTENMAVGRRLEGVYSRLRHES